MPKTHPLPDSKVPRNRRQEQVRQLNILGGTISHRQRCNEESDQPLAGPWHLVQSLLRLLLLFHGERIGSFRSWSTPPLLLLFGCFVSIRGILFRS